VSLSGNFLAYMIEELLGVNARFVGLAVAYNIGARVWVYLASCVRRYGVWASELVALAACYAYA
jgi:hypothetical protein